MGDDCLKSEPRGLYAGVRSGLGRFRRCHRDSTEGDLLSMATRLQTKYAALADRILTSAPDVRDRVVAAAVDLAIDCAALPHPVGAAIRNAILGKTPMDPQTRSALDVMQA